jgi:hypothetical protein
MESKKHLTAILRCNIYPASVGCGSDPLRCENSGVEGGCSIEFAPTDLLHRTNIAFQNPKRKEVKKLNRN